ncbi:ABC transporter ATP-binding protein [Marinobacterium aestuariivivens]|uniref:ABC transporter ATP-binding protein n=1 Tax=Marinobacterium aestuariivivens TaxID=1698799 RepID=A0ABW2A701_9GAMM
MARKQPFSDSVWRLLPAVHRHPLPQMPRSLYRYIWRISHRHQLGLSLLTLGVFPLTVAPLELQRRLIDDAIVGRDPELLVQLGALYLLLTLLRAGLKFLRNAYMDRVAEGVTRQLRHRVAHPEALDTASVDGTRQSIAASEAEKIGGFVADSIANPLLQLGTLISVAGYMLLVDPLIALGALAFLIPSLLLVGFTQPLLNRLSERKIGAIRDLGQALLRTDETETDGLIERIYRLRLRFTLIKHAVKQLNNLTNHLGPLSVLVVGGWLVIEGQAEVGTLVAFISGYERLTGPSRDLLNFYRQLALIRVQYRLVQKASQPLDP